MKRALSLLLLRAGLVVVSGCKKKEKTAKPVKTEQKVKKVKKAKAPKVKKAKAPKVKKVKKSKAVATPEVKEVM